MSNNELHFDELSEPRLTFMRHAIATPGADDHSRRLDAEGLIQCTKRRNEFFELQFKSDLVISSPAPRATETAYRCLTGLVEDLKIMELPILYMPDEESPLCEKVDELFERHGYGPVGAMLKDKDVGCLHDFAGLMTKSIGEKIRENRKPPCNVLVVAHYPHAVLLALFAHLLSVELTGEKGNFKLSEIEIHRLRRYEMPEGGAVTLDKTGEVFYHEDVSG